MAAKKRGAGIRHRLWLGLQLVLSISILACVLALLRIHSREPVSAPERTWRIPKVAFLFLARNNLPLDFVWHSFFQNAEEGNYSIYIHSEPGFVFDRHTTRSTFFYGRQIKRSIKVSWGESSMIEAERRLLAAALGDPANQRFVLVSDSCVPLYNFSYVYSYLMSSSRSFVDSFLDEKEERYQPKMSPTIPKAKWRKGSQWITLIRKHAEVVIADNAVFPIFKRHCKRVIESGIGKKHNAKSAAEKKHNCIPDEHYMQTLLSMKDLEHEVERRTLTYTSWNQSSDHMDTKTWHPQMFEYADASPQNIKEIKSINHVYYQTEYRTEWCRCNDSLVPCFLFARKFSRSAAMRILSERLFGPFNAASLFSSS